MTAASITIEFDPDRLAGYTDEYLAMLWHLAQHNPADGFEHSQPGELAMRVGWEIIRRWLAKVPPELYNHQQSHYYWRQLSKLAVYTPAGPAGDPAFDDGRWDARMIPVTGQLRDALAAKLADLKVFAAGNWSREQIAQELARIVLSSPPDDEDQDHSQGQDDRASRP